MCGIVGAVARRNVVPILIEGLKRLEYRGYDSAGIAVLDGGIRRVRRVGRVAEMVGFSSEEQLRRAWRRFEGTNPAEARRKRA